MNEDKIISFENVKGKLEKEHGFITTALKNLEEQYQFTRLSPYDFESEIQTGYSKHDIEQDMQLLAKKREKYGDATLEQKISKLKADFLERVIVVGISEFQWFGDKAESFLTSEFDDEINFIDGAVKFKVPKDATVYRMVGLDFDATFTSDIDSIYTKIHALKADLDNNKIPKLKYVHDERNEENGVLLPKVVLGCDNKSLDVLIKAIAEKDFTVLEDNPIADKLLIQAEAQLAAFKTRYGRKSSYYKDEASKETDSEKKTEFDLEHRLASRLFDMHSSILGLVNKAGDTRNTFSFANKNEFFQDAVHVKILDAASKINKQK